jgi:hypothetical protein
MFPSTAAIGWGSKMNHDGFAIETFEAGRGLWHARIRRTDRKPVVIDGVLFAAIEVGFAWSDPEAAIEDAKNQIDRLKLRRYAASAPMPAAQQSAA